MKNALFTIIMSGLLLTGCSSLQPQKSLDINGKKDINTSNEPQQKETPQEVPQNNNKLDLSNQNLQKIPEYVFSQTNLEELDVSNNMLTGAIKAEIRHLQNLKVLNASNNQMTGVPAEIGQLNNLQILNLSNNQITGLPYELGNLKNLKTFNLSGNSYSELDLGIIKEKLPSDVNIIK